MIEQLKHYEIEPVADHCGIIAAYASSDDRFFVTGLSGLIKLQTRGIDGAGIFARTSNGETANYKGRGMIHEAFSEDVVYKFRNINARSWLLQTRYGTILQKTKGILLLSINGRYKNRFSI